MKIIDVLALRSILGITPILQISIICALFIVTTFTQFQEYKKTGKLWVYSPVNTFLLFVPIYEEIIFRGFILIGLMSIYNSLTSIVISAVLFGLWHLKNIFYIPKRKLTEQILYAGLVFGPIAAYITLITGTIWLAVILHFLNNLLAPYFMKKKIT